MKDKLLGILLILIFGFIIFSIVRGYIIKNDVENGIESVGRYIEHDSWGKGETNMFEFYIDGIKYVGNGGRAPKDFSKNVGNFYKINIQTNIKEESKHIFLNELLTLQ